MATEEGPQTTLTTLVAEICLVPAAAEYVLSLIVASMIIEYAARFPVVTLMLVQGLLQLVCPVHALPQAELPS